jgi:hypothetical protein
MHAREGVERPLEHERRFEPQHGIAEPSERPIAARIGGAAPSVIAAIDLDDEPSRWRDEIGDETPERHLPPKPNAELPAAQQCPELLLRRSERRAHGDGALDDERLVSTGILGRWHETS